MIDSVPEWHRLLDWEIDDRWIFLQEKCIFREPFDVENDEFRQFGYFESFQKTVFVRFVLLFGDAIEFRQQLIQTDLKNINAFVSHIFHIHRKQIGHKPAE